MVEDLTDAPSPEAIRALLAEVAPDSSCLGIELLPCSYSNSSHLVRARTPGGSGLSLAVRRYRVFGSYDRGEKARRESTAFELVGRHGIPTPQPLHLDDRVAILGVPGIVPPTCRARRLPRQAVPCPGPRRWERC